jgi:hypothetical protein
VRGRYEPGLGSEIDPAGLQIALKAETVNMTELIQRLADRSGRELAVIVKAGFSTPGLHFLTPDDYGQQLGYMSHPAKHVIAAHVHQEVNRVVRNTMEVLLVRSGTVRVDLFDENLGHVATRVLSDGDVILLVAGGHRFEMLTDAEMIEVKQGPFLGTADKSRFNPDVPPLPDVR